MASTTFRFPTRNAAWAFMHACDAHGISAGFPSLTGEGETRTVEVSMCDAAEEFAAAFNGSVHEIAVAGGGVSL